MDSLSIFDIVSKIYHDQKSHEPFDVRIQFDNEKVFYARKSVLAQLKFFTNIFNDSVLEHNSNGEAIISISVSSDYFDNDTFYFLYIRLQNKLLNKKKKIHIPSDFMEQIKYLNMIDYLTDMDERADLLSDIKWTDMFWVGLVTIQFQNLDKFFSKEELYHGYKRCVAYLSTINKTTSKQRLELGIFFMVAEKVAAKENILLKIVIEETIIFKEIIRQIGNFIPNCCICFISTDKDDNTATNKNKMTQGGISITQLTSDKSVLVKLYIKAHNLKLFRCKETKISINIDMSRFISYLKMIDINDAIVLSMNYDNREKLYISTKKNNDSAMFMDVISTNNNELKISQTTFETKVTMDSYDFFKICRQINRMSPCIKISIINNEIIFRSENNQVSFALKCIESGTNTGTHEFDNFETNILVGLSKCYKFSNTIDIYLKKDFPLVFVISAGIMGTMYFFVSPVS